MNQENEEKMETPKLKNEEKVETAPASEEANTSMPETSAPTKESSSKEGESEMPAPKAPDVTPTKPAAEAQPAAPAPADNHQPKVQEEVIYNIKEEKGGNIIGVVLFFLVLLVALYFLPTISETLEPYIPWIKSIRKSPVPTPEKEDEEKDKKEDKKDDLYDLAGFVSDAGIDDLQLGNFVKDNNSGDNILKFYILNNADEAFVFNDNTKFFIDLYQGDKYLSSSLVYTYKDIGPKESIDFSIIIPADSYKKANKFKIVRKNKNEFKDVILNKQEGEYKVLTCEHNNNIIEYYFIDNYLEVINDTYSEKKDNPNYATDIEAYRKEGEKYTEIPSIDYNVIETTEGFDVKSRVDLQNINDVDLQKLEVYKYFSYHKENKVVSFEMTSLGYKCS